MRKFETESYKGKKVHQADKYEFDVLEIKTYVTSHEGDCKQTRKEAQKDINNQRKKSTKAHVK